MDYPNFIVSKQKEESISIQKVKGMYRTSNKFHVYSKTCVKQPLLKEPKFVLKTNYRLMQVKSIAECS